MTLEQRLARLERRNRWVTTALALVLVAMGGLVLVAAKQDKPKVMEEVRARGLVIVDAAGKERATIKCDDYGSEFMVRAGGDGSPLVAINTRLLGESSGFAQVLIQGRYDPAGFEKTSGESGGPARALGSRLVLATGGDGAAANSVVSIAGENGQVRMALKQSEATGSVFAIHNKDGKPLFKAPK